jgi:hypothetical protein
VREALIKNCHHRFIKIILGIYHSDPKKSTSTTYGKEA